MEVGGSSRSTREPPRKKMEAFAEEIVNCFH